MASFSQKNNFSKGVQLDLDQLRIPPDAAVFLKNVTRNVNSNASAPSTSGEGSNKDILSPGEGNVALSLSGMAAGTNYCVGFYSSEQTNEGYFFIWNSNTNHSIWVIRGDTGVVEKVYQNPLLNFQYDPRYFISQGRCTLELQSYVDPVTGDETNYKFLIFTFNYVNQFFIEVESSIATNSFSTTYFTASSAFYNPLELIHLGVPTPLNAIGLNDPIAYGPASGSSGIDTSSVSVGGTGYVVGDTFTVSGGSSLAEGIVTAISAGGVVTSFVITNPGNGYYASTSYVTVATSGIGTGLTINVEELAFPDSSLQNLTVRSGWQFRVKFIDVFGRESEHGIISEQYVTIVGGNCLVASNGLPRCLMINFDAGNPLVKFIQIEYRKWVGDTFVPSLATNWLIYETINKYDDSSAVAWYNRSINPLFLTTGSGIIYNSATNKIAYKFCADKNTIPIDVEETLRTEPGLPRISSSVASINKRLLLANNVRNFEPIAQTEIDKVTFTAQTPTDITCNANPTRTIVVYAAIYSFYAPPGPGGTPTGIIYMNHGKAVWGVGGDDCGSYGPFSCDQVFGDQTPNNSGFIGCLRGTSHKCISEQVDFDYLTGSSVVKGYEIGTIFSMAIQRFTFVDVPAGKYIFQIASHKAKITDGDCAKTSTYVAGQVPISNLGSIYTLNDYVDNPIKELEVDCTAGNVNLNQPADPLFVILDMSFPAAGAVMDGYLFEKVGENIPVEMAPTVFPAIAASGTTGDFWGSFFTDHNGFYFGGYRMTGNMALAVCTDMCDGSGTIARTLYGPVIGTSYPAYPTAGSLNQDDGGILHGDGSNTPSGACTGVHGNWKNRVYLVGSGSTYPDGARRVINQRIADCNDHALGLPGISVVMTKGAYGLTNTSGDVTLYAHNRYDFLTAIGTITPPPSAPPLSSIPDYSAGPYNTDKIIFSQNGGCEWTDCDTCNYFRDDITIEYRVCGAAPFGCTTTGMVGSNVKVSGGTGYTHGDTFTIDTGSTLAAGQIIGVSAGVVTSYILTELGSGYTTGVKATTATSGTGTGFTINILTITPSLRTLCLDHIYLKFSGVNLFGVQSGGAYVCGFVLHDEIGRHTFVQKKQGQQALVNIPNLNDVDGFYPAMALCTLKCDIDPSTVFPSVFTKMTPVVSANVSFTDYVSWGADWVQFIDNTGLTNSVNPTSIRIYYNSLNEYAKSNNWTTNTGWEFIDSGGGARFTPVEGDVVQFIMNGDGTWFESVISAVISYNKAGAFFVIDYLPELHDLMNGCLFRIIRPSANTSADNVVFYEQNYSIPLVNGAPAVLSFTVPYFDSYLLERQIPVPGLQGMGGPVAPGSNITGTPYPIVYTSTNQDDTLTTSGYATNNIGNSNGVVVFEAVDFSTSYPFFFESPSPSDTWGSHLACKGRVMVENPFEAQVRTGTEIALSAALSDRSSLNGLSYYESKNSQIFDRNTWGDITVVLVETSIMLVICDRDHFLTQYNTTQLRVDASGNVNAQNQLGIFTSPLRKAGSNFGCGQWDINSIARYTGIAVWLDSSGYLVFHNFSEAKAAQFNGYDAYLKNKIGYTKNWNNQAASIDSKYFVGGIDVKTWEYYLTSFRKRYTDPGTGLTVNPSFINTESTTVLSANETLIIDLDTGALKGFASFTPEMMGNMSGYYLQSNFITFKNGVPYIHHNNRAVTTTPPLYANFYGTQCECRITIVCNVGPEKVKRFFYVEVYSRAALLTGIAGTLPQVVFYADNITTEKNQLSRLKPLRWVQKDGIWRSEFLCDLNTPVDPNLPTQTGINKLLDGVPLQGRWMKLSLVTQSSYAGTYFEVSSVNIVGNGVEKSAD